jgi:hypothetical protein
LIKGPTYKFFEFELDSDSVEYDNIYEISEKKGRLEGKDNVSMLAH